MWGTLVSEMQTDLSVDNSGNKITGTLSYLSSGTLVSDWGAGYFMALHFTIPTGSTSVKVGMDPSQGSGLVELIGDPDGNGVFKVTDKDTQVFKIVTQKGNKSTTKTYSLAQLVLAPQTPIE